MYEGNQHEIREEIIGLQTAQDVLDRCKREADRERIQKLMLGMVQRIEAQLIEQLDQSGDATNRTD